MNVFIGGSRGINRLPEQVIQRIDTVINRSFTILIGDATGVDKAVQQYVYNKQYDKVVVYCTGDVCRNNIGRWDVRHVMSDKKLRGFDFYALKDECMAKEADYGFMLWDGRSKGTLNNILNLLREKKRILTYFLPDNEFLRIYDAQGLVKLLDKIDQEVVQAFDLTLKIRQRLAPEQIELPFTSASLTPT